MFWDGGLGSLYGQNAQMRILSQRAREDADIAANEAREWRDYAHQVEAALTELRASRNRVSGIQQAYKRRMLQLADLAGMTDEEKELLVKQAKQEGHAQGEEWNKEDGIAA